jgi:hypothetical protein
MIFFLDFLSFGRFPVQAFVSPGLPNFGRLATGSQLFFHFICFWNSCAQVGPYANPSETYPFYSLPFCKPDSVESPSQELGDTLSGDRRVSTMYAIAFKGVYSVRGWSCLRNWCCIEHNRFFRFTVSKPADRLCTRVLSEADVKKFAHAVEEDFFVSTGVCEADFSACSALPHTARVVLAKALSLRLSSKCSWMSYRCTISLASMSTRT